MSPETILQYAYILIGIGAIIFVHELGHFITAKIAKVRVEGFSLGMPPTGIAFRRTVAGLRVSFLPLFFRRAVPEVGCVEEGSPADAAGLRIGDRLLEINGKPAGMLDYAGLSKLADSGQDPVTVRVLRGKTRRDFSVGRIQGRTGVGALGLFPHLSEQMGKIRFKDQAWLEGLAEGEKVLSAADRDFADRGEFVQFAEEAVARGAGVVRLEVSAGEGAEVRRIALGVRPAVYDAALSFALPVLRGVEGETSYRLSLLPLGGYVKMAGDVPQELRGNDDEFLSKGVGHRAMIFAAGSVMNIFFALLCFILAYQVGVQSVSPEVGRTHAGSPAQEAGLEPGDRIVAINGAVIADFWDIPQEVAYSNPAGGLRFTVRRSGETLTLPPPDRPPVKAVYDKEGGRYIAGIEPVYTNTIEKMAKDSPFYYAGMRPKDSITALNGAPTEDGYALVGRFNTLMAQGVPVLKASVRKAGGAEEEVEIAVPEGVKKSWRFGIVIEWLAAVEAAPATGPWSALAGGDLVHAALPGVENMNDSLAAHVEAIASEKPFPIELSILVTRGGEKVRVPVTIRSEAEAKDFTGTLKVENFIRVKEIGGRSRFAEAGIPEGALLYKAGGRALSSQKDLIDLVNASGGAPVDLEVSEDGGARRAASAAPVPSFDVSLSEMGVSIREKREDLRLGFFESVKIGAFKSYEFAVNVFRTLFGIFRGNIGGENLGGPLMIIVASYKFSEYGLGKLLFFLGIISINLGLINLFPIPILDGGHLVFLLIEKVKGSPLSETAQAIAQYAGLLALLLLMVYVTKNDITRFFF